MNEAVQRAQSWLEAHHDDLLAATREMLQIPSIQGDPEPGAPFGAENRKALDLALKWGEDWGFSTSNVEGYCGWAETGQGKMVLVMGHLDVVPVSNEWKHQPFGAEIDGDYIYARGAVDDKGPTVAAFFAARALKETCPQLPGRLRMFFGSNEESGFHCVERYVKTEEIPTLGVAPDSGWPLYYAEKGIVNFNITFPIPESAFQLTAIRGGSRPNIVIDRVDASVKVGADIRAEVDEKLADSWDKNVTWQWDGDILKVVALGKAAHGAAPFFGDSAGTRMFRFLLSLAPVADRELYEALLMTTHSSGVGLGIHGRDDVSEDLTANLGLVDFENGGVKMLYNIRRPVTWGDDELPKRLQAFAAKCEQKPVVEVLSSSTPLYFPLDHVLTKTIVEVYRAETGDMREPGTMGGGTYARAVPNCVSIGTSWKGDGPAHENDERVKIEHLYKMAKIYVHLFYRLMEEASKLP